MNNSLHKDFKEELLRTDLVPRKLNNVSQKYKLLLLEDLKSNVIQTETVTICQCGSTELEELTKIDRFGLPFGSLICKDCGLILTSPRIIQGFLPYYYDKYYHPLNYGKESVKDHDALFAKGQGKKIFNILRPHLNNRKKLKVLEIGAGTGSVLSEFKNEAKTYNIMIEELGTEYSTDCIKRAKKDNINIMYGGLEELSQLNKNYDVIILSHVFEHFIDLQYATVIIKSLLKSDGLLYIEVPGIFSIHKKNYYDFSFLGYLIHAHIYNFTKTTLLKTLYAFGLNVIYSNEEIEAVFVNQKQEDTISFINTYQRTMFYLEFLNNNSVYFQEEFTKKNNLSILINKKNIQVENRDTSILKLQDIIKNRESEIKKLKMQLENRTKEIQTLKNKIEEIQLIRTSQINELTAELENRTKEIQTLKNKIEEIQLIRTSQINELTAELENRTKEIQTLKNKIEEIQLIRTSQINELTAELENSNSNFQILETQSNKYNNLVNSFQSTSLFLTPTIKYNLYKKITSFQIKSSSSDINKVILDSPLISVIIPVYNVEQYLQKSILSITNQTYKNIEIITINDGSTDDSLKILKKLQNNDKRIKIIEQQNQGLSGARNSGLIHATGEYVVFVDSDDTVEPNMLEELVDFATQDNLDIVVYGYTKLLENGKIIAKPNFGDKTISNDEARRMSISLKLSPMACNKFYKRSLFSNKKIKFPIGFLHEDIGTTYKLFWDASKVGVTSKSYYNWMVRGSSITGTFTKKHIEDIIFLLDEKKKFLVENEEYEKYQTEYIRAFFQIKTLLLERALSSSTIDNNLVNYLLEKLDMHNTVTETNVKLLKNYDTSLYKKYQSFFKKAMLFNENLSNITNKKSIKTSDLPTQISLKETVFPHGSTRKKIAKKLKKLIIKVLQNER